jgi:hypothetical protein
MKKIVNGVEIELSEQEIIEFQERAQAHEEYLNSLEFRQRQAVLQREYPPIGEQLDMLYHDKINGTNNWETTIAAIKAAHPKPQQ